MKIYNIHSKIFLEKCLTFMIGICADLCSRISVRMWGGGGEKGSLENKILTHKVSNNISEPLLCSRSFFLYHFPLQMFSKHYIRRYTAPS